MNIMSHIITLLFSFLFLFENNIYDKNNSFRNPGKADTVNWNVQRKLMWDDFKGIPKHHSNFSAETHYVITKRILTETLKSNSGYIAILKKTGPGLKNTIEIPNY